MCVTVFLSLKSKLTSSHLQKFGNLTIHLLGRLWENRYSHTLLVGMKHGTISMEGDLVISNKTIYAFILYPPNLTSSNLS